MWKEEEHWRPLWEDLQLVVDELMDRQAEASNRIELEAVGQKTGRLLRVAGRVEPRGFVNGGGADVRELDGERDVLILSILKRVCVEGE